MSLSLSGGSVVGWRSPKHHRKRRSSTSKQISELDWQLSTFGGAAGCSVATASLLSCDFSLVKLCFNSSSRNTDSSSARHSAIDGDLERPPASCPSLAIYN